jgi:hypothetical protein
VVVGGDFMTKRRQNLAGIGTTEMLEKLKAGERFFVQTDYVNCTRQLLNGIKVKHGIQATTKQDVDGILIMGLPLPRSIPM